MSTAPDVVEKTARMVQRGTLLRFKGRTRCVVYVAPAQDQLLLELLTADSTRTVVFFPPSQVLLVVPHL